MAVTSKLAVISKKTREGEKDRLHPIPAPTGHFRVERDKNLPFGEVVRRLDAEKDAPAYELLTRAR